MEKNNPLSPHIQIYSWHLSSLISISNRIVGVVNLVALVVICLWIIMLLFGETKYDYIKFFLQSYFGKFFIIALSWSFSFQILSEIRHLIWDLGYGFELKTAKISGILVIFGSFVLAVIIYLLGKQIA
jgi:succinate dehydrogenase / fumarate reductase cytochrome b subunit